MRTKKLNHSRLNIKYHIPLGGAALEPLRGVALLPPLLVYLAAGPRLLTLSSATIRAPPNLFTNIIPKKLTMKSISLN